MDERLAQLQRRIGVTRRRIEDAERRLAAVRERLQERGGSAEQRAASSEEGLPLFAGLGLVGSLDDLELHFEALGTEEESEDPTTEERER